MPDARQIADALACGKPGCECNRPPSRNGERRTHCPGPRHKHNDADPALSVTEEDGGKVLVHCNVGCTQDEVISALRQKGLWGSNHPEMPVTVLHPPKTPDSRYEKGRQGVTKENVTPVTVIQSDGLTLKALASAKKLPPDFLKSLGISDFKYKGQPAVRIPCHDSDGNQTAIRFRLNLTGSRRFVWRSGDHAQLYGLERLAEARKAGWVLLVEGESDCWTCWYDQVPALGIPGKSTWKPEWATYLQGVNELYLWQEPDAADLTQRILQSLPNLKVIIAEATVKDPSEVHLQGVDLASYIAARKLTARFAADIDREAKDTRLLELQKAARPVLESRRDILDALQEAFHRLGYGGDKTPALICYLAATSRLLSLRPGGMPVHLLLSGPSSIGKSWTWAVVRSLLPGDSFVEIHAGSPRVLLYGDYDLKHRVLVFSEADSMPKGEDSSPASAIRNLLQEGRLHYQVTIKDDKTNEYRVKTIEKEGPTVLVTTSVKRLPPQLGTRLFSLELPDGKDQVQAALQMQAILETSGAATPDAELIAYQDYLQALAPWDVVVPFAVALAQAIGRKENAPRVLRDYSRLLSLVKSLAVLRHSRRQRDARGRVVARLEDYQAVRDLIGEMYETSIAGTSIRLREIVEAVSKEEAAAQESERISVSTIAAKLDLPKMSVSRVVRLAVKNGWLINTEPRKGYPANLITGDPLPAPAGLPTVEELQKAGEGVTTVTGCNSPHVTPPQIEPQIGAGQGVTLYQGFRGDTGEGVPGHADVPEPEAAWKL